MGITSLWDGGPHFFRLKIMKTTVKNTPAQAQTVRASVNEKQLLSTMKHLFKSNFSFLGELMQNARRAGASLVRFEFDPESKTLIVSDNGCGIEDFGKLIDLCTSGWAEDVQIADNPFGMGFFSVFFACDHITVRSRGLTLTASHDDIMSKRLIQVVDDEVPVRYGVILELHGLKPELLIHQEFYANRTGDKMEAYELYRHLRKFSMGFPIEVQSNGTSLPRPHAQAALKGEETAYGFIHMAQVHGGKESKPLSDHISDTAFYLQGLPIDHKRPGNTHNVVHLSSAKFTPQMPDRAYLRDADKALAELQLVLRGKVCEFLAGQKKTVPAFEFVNEHWNQCMKYGVSHLLNDIPFAPTSAFGVISQLTDRAEDRWTHYSNAANCVRMEDISDGKISVWRDVPQDIDDSDHWAVLQLLMARNNILLLSANELNAEHWLNKRTPSCDDFKVTVTPIADTSKSSKYQLENFNCDIQLVEAVVITVTSDVDADFKLEYRIDDDFVVVGKERLDSENFYENEVVVYAMTSGNYNESPVKLFSSFYDENERYDEEWEDNASQDWLSIINALQGLSLASNIELGINRMQITIADQQIGHMAVVHASRAWNENREDYGYQRLQVVDLESQAVWDKLSELLATGPGLDGNIVKAAFIEAIGGVGHMGKPIPTEA